MYHCIEAMSVTFFKVNVLTCYPADFMATEVPGDPCNMRSQTVTQQVNLLPGQLQLFLK